MIYFLLITLVFSLPRKPDAALQLHNEQMKLRNQLSMIEAFDTSNGINQKKTLRNIKSNIDNRKLEKARKKLEIQLLIRKNAALKYAIDKSKYLTLNDIVARDMKLVYHKGILSRIFKTQPKDNIIADNILQMKEEEVKKLFTDTKRKTDPLRSIYPDINLKITIQKAKSATNNKSPPK